MIGCNGNNSYDSTMKYELVLSAKKASLFSLVVLNVALYILTYADYQAQNQIKG